MKTFLIKTLGCKVNSYESEFIRTIMLNDGYEEVNENADICIVNTCTVTNTADNKSKQVINNIRKNNPEAIVVACGCFCEFRQDNIDNLINAEIIIGNKNKSKIMPKIKLNNSHISLSMLTILLPPYRYRRLNLYLFKRQF